MKHFVKSRLIKSKTKQENEALHAIVEACTYTHSDGDDHNSVRKILGFTTGTFYRNIIKQSNGMDMTSYANIKQNKRNQTELLKNKNNAYLPSVILTSLLPLIQTRRGLWK